MVKSGIVYDPEKKNAAGRVLTQYSKLSKELRSALIPALQEITGILLIWNSRIDNKNLKVEKIDLAELSIELFQNFTPSSSAADTGIGVGMFLLAFMGAVLNLPSFLLLDADSIYLRIIWRYAGVAIMTSPFFLYDILVNIANFWDIFIANIFPIFFLSLLNTAYVYMVYFAVNHTFVAHTLLLCSIAGTFNAVWKIAKREPYTSIEYIGIGINVFGAYLCCCEGSPIDRKSILIGNLVAILSSAVAAIYGNLAKPVTADKNKCPTSVFLMLMSGYIIAISYVLSFFFNERIDIFSMNEEYGLLAFMTTWKSFFYGFIGLGVMAGFVYHYFTIKSQEYIGTMFVSVCYNFTPFISQVTSYVIGAQPFLPGTFTALGGASLFVGCTLLFMNYNDQQYLAHVPLVAKIDEESHPVEMQTEIMKPPIVPDYAQPGTP